MQHNGQYSALVRIAYLFLHFHARPSVVVHEPLETAIEAAAGQQAWTCVRLLLDECEPNAALAIFSDTEIWTSVGFATVIATGPVSNLHVFLDFVERRLSEAWKLDPDNAYYFQSHLTKAEAVHECLVGLKLSIQAGADVDLPYQTAFRSDTFPPPLHAFHQRIATTPEWYPTYLDYIFY